MMFLPVVYSMGIFYLNLPKNFLELLRPTPKAKATPVASKLLRQKARGEEQAVEFARQAQEGNQWSEVFFNTPLQETRLSPEDKLQNVMLQYASAMGVPVEGNALSDNFSRWGRTRAGYVDEKCKHLEVEAAKANQTEAAEGPDACLPLELYSAEDMLGLLVDADQREHHR